MSAPIDHSLLAPPVESRFAYTAALWRGAMLDRFARAEDCILRCLEELQGCGITLPRDAFHEGAKARLRALLAVLSNDPFEGRSVHAVKLLDRLLSLLDLRSALAHGLLVERESGLTVRWRRCKGADGAELELRQIDILAVAVKLAELDALQRNLSSELGQVRKVARQRAGPQAL